MVSFGKSTTVTEYSIGVIYRKDCHQFQLMWILYWSILPNICNNVSAHPPALIFPFNLIFIFMVDNKDYLDLVWSMYLVFLQLMRLILDSQRF